MAGFSYAECRDHVAVQLGNCQVSPDVIEVNLLGVLEDFKNRIGSDATKVIKVNLAVVAGTYSYTVPVTVDRALSIENENGEELYVVPYNASDSPVPVKGRPVSWRLDDGKIILYPTPVLSATFVIRGSKPRDHVLYDVDTSTSQKKWRIVDLPVGLHYAYIDAVLAQCLMIEDPGRAQVFAESAMNRLAAWNNDQQRALQPGGHRRLLQSSTEAKPSWRQGSRFFFSDDSALPVPTPPTPPPTPLPTGPTIVDVTAWTLTEAWTLSAAVYNSDGALISASIRWPDGILGLFIGVASVPFPAALGSFTVTRGIVVITQPLITRDSLGRIVTRPALVFS